MSSPILIQNAVYCARNTVTNGNHQVNRDDYLSYRGTTGMKDSDDVVGFEFYNVTQRTFVKVSVYDIACLINGSDYDNIDCPINGSDHD